MADVNTESSRICEYIDYFLQPLSTLHPAYIKDTYDFVQKIRGTEVDPSWLLITADVESLYTNMQLHRIIETVQEAFEEFPDPSRPDHALIELLKITLYYNDFEFDSQFFLQICGVAMGRKYAPSTANLYLKKFDKAAREDFHIHPLLYSRFLDDIFGVWPGTRAQLTLFQEFLNSLIPGIKVTFTVRTHIIEFLDTQIYKHYDSEGRCTLQTKVYFKPTDTHQLLHRTSFHPTHTFDSIINCQFIRFKRISSCVQDFQQACSILIEVLTTRGYSLSKLLRMKRKIWHNYITDPSVNHTTDSQTTKKDIIPVITYYDLHHSRINRKWSTILRDNPILRDTRIISAYKKHRNLRNILVKGRYTTQDPAELLLSALIAAL